MLKKYIIPILLIIIAFVIKLIVNALTTIDSRGMIHEPFALIVLAEVVFFVGLIWAIIILIKSIIKRK